MKILFTCYSCGIGLGVEQLSESRIRRPMRCPCGKQNLFFSWQIKEDVAILNQLNDLELYSWGVR